MLKQEIEERKSRTVNTGTMGFDDYETIYDMTFTQFVDYITKKYNQPHIKVISISYPNTELAVVTFKEKQIKENTHNETTSKN